MINHKFTVGTAASKKKHHNVAKDTLYNFAPQFDADIRTTQKNLNDAEVKLNHKWNIEDVQTDSDIKADAESDPICSSAGCGQYRHKPTDLGYPIDYYVPNFGGDQDIVDSKHSLEISEN